MQQLVNDAEREAALALLSAHAVRARARKMFELGIDDKLPNFAVFPEKLDAVTDFVSQVTRENYPSLQIPFHSRWRHFVAGPVDRWRETADAMQWPDRLARARSEFDLAVVSILLDAGAGPHWRYADPIDGRSVGRSEGLALASLAMFRDGLFSARPGEPYRVDAAVLAELSTDDLAQAFQVSDDNKLAGLDGRAALLRRLGQHMLASPSAFSAGDSVRPGGLADYLLGDASSETVAAPKILEALLVHLGPIWSGRSMLGGIALGDCWVHPALDMGGPTAHLVPLHKLSQWLAYSLIEPLERADVAVTDVDGLTGLAEYRNGGLFLDMGVLTLRDPALVTQKHDVSSPLVVEWRALTVALLDELAMRYRKKHDLSATTFPLAKLLEGGTWAAGRRVAQTLRADGGPPLHIVSDGTVF